MQRRVILLSTLALLFIARTPAASGQAILGPGTVVRVHGTTQNSAPFEGMLISRTPDTVVVAAKGGGPGVRFPQNAISSIEMQNGKKRLGPALKWAVVGGVIWGAVSAALPYRECDPQRFSNCADALSRSEFISSNAIGMAFLTGTIGAVRGSPKWVRVEGPTARSVP